jgi:hypothetical protein
LPVSSTLVILAEIYNLISALKIVPIFSKM